MRDYISILKIILFIISPQSRWLSSLVFQSTQCEIQYIDYSYYNAMYCMAVYTIFYVMLQINLLDLKQNPLRNRYDTPEIVLQLTKQ